VRILLDTQCFLWMHSDPERLSRRARRLLTDVDNDLLLSAASAWEIAIKAALGKLRLPEPIPEYVTSRMAEAAVQGLAIEHAHALRVATLPGHHTDPFDRLLIAQAEIEDLAILTSDRQFSEYDVRVLQA
jgi:PIN domain nuclease of toxin-antitoxin system